MRKIFVVLLLILSIAWFWKAPISGHGGLPFFKRITIPLFLQADPRWAHDFLGESSTDNLAKYGCALSSAAMVLTYYTPSTAACPKPMRSELSSTDDENKGWRFAQNPLSDTLPAARLVALVSPEYYSSQGIVVRADVLSPQGLNQYLREHDGYEGASWMKWEVAANWLSQKIEHLYEDLPSYWLIDSNLLAGNPVIVRLRKPDGTTHFVVIVGKQGFDYLIRDPGPKGASGLYPVRETTFVIDGLRYYGKRD